MPIGLQSADAGDSFKPKLKDDYLWKKRFLTQTGQYY